jgi:hypothetical protein
MRRVLLSLVVVAALGVSLMLAAADSQAQQPGPTLAQVSLEGVTGSDDLNDSSTLTCLVYDDAGNLVARFSSRVGCLRDHRPWGPIQVPVLNKNAKMASLVRGKVTLKITGDTDCWRTSFSLRLRGSDDQTLTAGMDAIELRTDRAPSITVGIEGIIRK